MMFKQYDWMRCVWAIYCVTQLNRIQGLNLVVVGLNFMTYRIDILNIFCQVIQGWLNTWYWNKSKWVKVDQTLGW